jgi:hypothetical protein
MLIDFASRVAGQRTIAQPRRHWRLGATGVSLARTDPMPAVVAELILLAPAGSVIIGEPAVLLWPGSDSEFCGIGNLNSWRERTQLHWFQIN